jgi:hypothetical protein
MLDFLDTIPNHLRIQVNTKFFDDPPPKNQAVFDSGLAEFSNQFHVVAIQDPKVIEEWEKIYSGQENQFSNLLSGGSEKIALENFISTQMHPRFVYFSDYKKIYGNINLNEYIREEKGERGESIEYIEEFDKAETVRNLFYLAELDINELEAVKDSPSRNIKLLNAASNRLTKKLNPAWKGDPIHVDLRYNPRPVRRSNTEMPGDILKAVTFQVPGSNVVHLCQQIRVYNMTAIHLKFFIRNCSLGNIQA